jgi:hypothetical protein
VSVNIQEYTRGRQLRVKGSEQPSLLTNRDAHFGWEYENNRQRDMAQIRQRENGLDYKSLDKLSAQLKALGFDIPNEN